MLNLLLKQDVDKNLQVPLQDLSCVEPLFEIKMANPADREINRLGIGKTRENYLEETRDDIATVRMVTPTTQVTSPASPF